MRNLLIGIMIGVLFMMTGSAFAQQMRSFFLSEATYDLYVDGVKYTSEDKPVLTYKGSTYVPIREVAELLGIQLIWNSEKKRVEINLASENASNGFSQKERFEVSIGKQSQQQNDVFRNLCIYGTHGHYVIQGEAKASHQVFYYAISDGHRYLVEDQYLLKESLDKSFEKENEWVPFTLVITLAEHQLPSNGTLMLEMFDGLDENGFRTNMLFLLLERFTPEQ